MFLIQLFSDGFNTLSQSSKSAGVATHDLSVPHGVWMKHPYLNNLIEQDHRRIKQCINLMLGFKKFGNAAVTISGVELAHKIRKGQFNTDQLTRGVKVREPQMWEAVLGD